MAKKKKKKIVASVGLDGTINKYNSTPTNKKVVARVSLDGDIAPIKTTPKTTTTTVTKPKYKRSEQKKGWFSSGAFSDGYDFGDVTRTILGTATDISQDMNRGALNIVEGALDLGTYAVSGGAKALGFDKVAEKTKKFGQRNLVDEYGLDNLGANTSAIGQVNRILNGGDILPTRLDSKTRKDYMADIFSDRNIERNSVLGTKSDQVSEGVGYVAGMTVGSMMGLPPTATAFVTSAGNEMTNAFNNNATYGQAFTSGLVSGLAEAGSEKLFGGLGKINGAGAFDDQVGRLVGRLFKKQWTKNIAEFGIKAMGEGLEEIISSAGQELGRALSYGSEYEDPIDFLTDEKRLEEFINGAIVSSIVQAPSFAINTVQNRDYISNMTESEQELVEQEAEKRIEQAEQKGTKLTDKQKNQIRTEVEEELKRNNFKPVQEDIAPVKEEIAPIQEELKTSEDTEVQQVIEETQELEKALKQQNYKYVPKDTDSPQRRAISEDASKYANNTPRTQEFIDLTVNISEASGVNFRLANNEAELITSEKTKLIEKYAKNNNVTIEEATERFKNTTIDAYNNGEIVINIDSPKALNRLVGHEITHSLESTQEYNSKMQNIAIEYAKTKGDYDSRVERLEALYEGTNADVTKELTADIISDYLFSDQEFINNIHAQDRNLFQRIYDEVKHLIKMATAGSKEARQLEQLKHSFEKAMRENKATSETSISENTINTELAKEISYKTKNNFKDNEVVEMVSTDEIDTIERSGGGYRTTEEVNKLTEGIKKDGITEPLNVEVREDGSLYLENGNHRLNQAKELGLEEVPVVVSDKGETKKYSEYQKTPTQEELDNLEDIRLNKSGSEYADAFYKLEKKYGKANLYKGLNSYKTTGKATEYSLTDNQGRELSKEQQEFFKDSKARDDKGNLLTMYHGTNSDFNIFKRGKKGYLGGGIYLTDSKNFAEKYTDYGMVKEVYVDMKQPLTVTSNNPTKEILNVIYGSDKVYNNRSSKQANDTYIITKADLNKLQSKGYDGIVWKFPSGDEYMVFNSNQIKNVDNTNPTSDPDIRYSLSKTPTQDNKGRTLTEGQRDYFKNEDRNLIDKDGNLKVLYHGTPFGEFTTFKGDMFFFSEDYKFAEDYADSKSFEQGLDGDRRVVEAYIKTENVFDVTNPDDIQKLRETLSDEINFWGRTWDKETLLRKLQRKDTLPPKWKPEQIDGKRFGDYIGDDRNGYNTDMFVGVNEQNEIVYISQERGLQNLSQAEKDMFQKELMAGKEVSYVTYQTIYGDLSEQGIHEKISELQKQGEEYKRENGVENEAYNYYIKELEQTLKWIEKDLATDIKHKLIPKTATQETTELTDIDNWTYFETAFDSETRKDIVDIVKDLGYDAINIYESGISNYIVFNPNQIKNVTNENPTNNLDINLSLSNQEQDIAPTSADIFGSEIKLQQQVRKAIAPLQETIQELNNKITTLQENIAPIKGYTDEDISLSNQRNIESLEAQDIAPIEDTSPDVMPTNEILNDPFEDRDIKAVGNRKVNAYMYENPEVKPFFQDEARVMLGDLHNSIKGEKVWLQELNPATGLYEENMVTGTQRLTTDDIAELLDVYHYTYAQIEKGLNNIIEDNGKENNAVSKRIEFMLNDRLLNGYKSVDGFPIPPNNEYRALIRNKNIQEYTEQAYQEWNKSINQDELLPSDIEYVSNSMPKAENVPIENDIAPTDVDIPAQTNEPRIENIMFADPMDMFRGQFNRQMEEQTSFSRSEPKVAKTKRQQLGDAWSKFQEQFVNRNYQIDKLSKDTGNKQIKYNADMLNSVAGEIEGDIFTAQTDNYGNPIAESLSSLFEPSKKGGYYEAFDDYLKHFSNIDRHRAGKGSVVPLEYSRKMIAEYEKTYPTMRAEATKVWKYGKNLLANMQSNGLINGQFNSTLQSMYPHYVPFMQSEDLVPFMSDDGTIRPKKAIKSAKGGAYDILGIEEAFTKYTYATKKAIRQNDLYKEIVNTSQNKVSFGADNRVDPTSLNESLGVDSKGNHFVTAYVNGEMKQATISEDLYNELSRDAENRIRALEERYAIVTKPLQGAGKLRRNLLTTWSPTFVATNFIKDVQDGLLNSKYTRDFMKNYPTAFGELARAKTPEARQFLTLYGSASMMGEFDVDSVNQNAKNGKFLKNVTSRVTNLNNIIELAPRFAEFKASLENGANIQEAMYNAREVTLNFGRGGYITKAVNRNGFTFLNASVQGFDKLIRNFSGENGAKGVASALTKTVMFGVAPAIFNALAFGVGDDEDEDYKALPDYIKDNYYLIKTSEGEFIRIPKGRMLSIFGSAGRRTLEYMQGEEDAFEGFLTNAYSQVGVQNPLESNIFAPIIQAKSNKTWYGSDLVPTRLQDKPTEEQYDETTDEFSKWLGQTALMKNLGISPYKINYVLDQYSGGIGDLILPTITEEATSDGNLLAPIKDKFTANTTFDNKYVSDFYGTKEKMEVKANGSKATEEDLLRSKYLTSVSYEMSELYKEKREVQSNSDLTKEQKFKKVQAIQKQINSLAEEGLNSYQNINKTSNYAVVGDREFYKDANDEWRTPYDDELEELNSLGMDIDDKSSYFEAKNGIYLINEEYRGTEDTYEEKKRDIINVVRNSTLNTDYKSYLYGKYYSEDTTNIVNMLGIDFDAYLDYESQSFVADKDKYGKSISGSKKKKVFDYINSMNIGFEEKVILAKLQYNSYDEYNYEIINYLNKSNITYDEMEFILKQMGFDVDKDGNIYWD